MSKARTSAAVALAAGLASAATPALAQNGTLHVQVTPALIYSGESATVNVVARFPSTMYAFASADFDVSATEPGWLAASSGAIVGADVLGVNVWQAHVPQAGIFANPANPFRVWRGTYSPLGKAPALVEIAADPFSMAVYPSRLTSSWASCDVAGGSDWLFVNPLDVGGWVAAPGEGTSIAVQDDVWVDGKIITAPGPARSILIGMLVPAVQKVREAAIQVRFDGLPDSFSATIDIQGRPGEQITMGYTAAEWTRSGDDHPYRLKADLGGPAGSPVYFEAFLGGTYVAAGDLNADGSGLIVERVPEGISASVKMSASTSEPRATYELKTLYVSSWATSAGSEGPVRVLLPDGRLILADSISLEATRQVAGAGRQINNLKQIGLGAHLLEATGVERMSVAPGQTR